MPEPIGVLVLAAGEASRMGRAKQLLPVGGVPMLRRAGEEALAAACGPVFVVLGARAEEVASALDGLDVTQVVNPRWQEGMGTSIRTGLSAMSPLGLDGLILTLADQPLIGERHYRELIRLHRETGAPMVASVYAGTVGVPAFFDRASFGLLDALGPEQGCKGILTGHAAVTATMPCPEAELDIDTQEDYARIA